MVACNFINNSSVGGLDSGSSFIRSFTVGWGVYYREASVGVSSKQFERHFNVNPSGAVTRTETNVPFGIFSG